MQILRQLRLVLRAYAVVQAYEFRLRLALTRYQRFLSDWLIVEGLWVFLVERKFEPSFLA